MSGRVRLQSSTPDVRMRYPFRRALKDNGARFAFLHPLLVTKNKKQISNRI